MLVCAPRKRIVFAGGGHAHLYSLARVGELVRRGFDVTLVDSSPYLYYSGMATGVISGAYGPEEHRIDVRRLVVEGGGTFIEGRVTEIRSDDRAFLLDSGDTVPYDTASVCLGSEVSRGDPTEGEARAIRVKPVENIREIRHRLLDFGENRTPKVLVVGGGAAGCEIAANTLTLLDELHLGGELVIAQNGEALLPRAPKKAQKEISRFLRERGAQVLTKTSITRLGAGTAWTADGRGLPCDLPVLAIGVSPPDIFRASGLPTGEDDGLWVNRYLQSIGDDRLFGGGDCVSFRGGALPKLGVFSVRQGPLIFRNLQAVLDGRSLADYRPQKRFLYVLNFGDGTGLIVYDSLVWRGRVSWELKRRIDKKFILKHRHQRLST